MSNGLSMAVKVTGESEFTRALNNIRQNLREVSAQMALTSSAFAKNDTSMSALTSKYNVLSDKLSIQKDKVEALKKQYASMSEQYTKSTEKHNALLNKYEEEKAKLDNIGKTLGTTSSEYKQQYKVVADLSEQVSKSTKTQDANEKSMSNMRTQITRAEADVKRTERTMAVFEDQMAQNREEADKSNTAYEKLKSTISEQEAKLQSLVSEYKNVVLTQGENSDAAKKLAGEIDKLSGDLNENKEKLNSADKAADELTNSFNQNSDSAKKTSNAYDTLKSTISDQESKLRSLKDQYSNVVLEQGKNSKAAKSLEKEMSELDGELSENKSKLKEAESASDELTKSLDETGKSAEKSSGGFTVLKGAIANLISQGIQKLASAVRDQLGAAISRVDTINSYKKTMENLGYSTEEVAETTDKLKSGILGLPTTLPGIISAQQQYAALSGNIDEATNLTLALNDATLAGGQGQEVANSAMEQWYQIIAKGKPDAQSWQIINSAMPAQMNQIAESVMGAGKKSQDLFSAWQNGTVTTQQVIDSLIRLDSEGGSGLASFQQQAQDSTGGIETSMTNLKTSIATGMANIIESFGSENIASVLNGLKKIIQTVFSALGKAIQFVIDNSDLFVGALTAMAAGIGAYVLYTTPLSTMVKMFKSLTIVTKAQTAAQWLLNAAQNASGTGLLIAGIAALVAAFVVLWNKSEGFRNFWIGLWENIKTVVQPVIESLSQWFSEAWEKVKEIWSPVAEFFSNLFVSIGESVKPVIDSISSAFKEAWALVKSVWDLVSPYFKMVWENIKIIFSVVKDVLGGFFKAAWEIIKAVWNVAVPFFQTIWNNIKAIFGVVKAVLGGYFKTAWEAIKAVWNVATSFFKAIWDSIAKIFSVVKNVLTGNWRDAWEGIKGIVNTWVGFFKTVWQNIKNVFSAVKDFFKNSFSAAWEAVKSVFSNWGSFFGGLWDIIRNKFSSIGTNIANAIGGAVKSGINGVISMIENTINSAINLINGAIDLINMIPGVGIGRLGGLRLPRLARGGVIDNGARTVIAGEDGAEAIVPLERNTKWIKMVAAQLQNSLLSGFGLNRTLNENLSNRNTQYEYNMLVDSFKQALSEMSIEMDDQTMGKFIEKTVARAIYS